MATMPLRRLGRTCYRLQSSRNLSRNRSHQFGYLHGRRYDFGVPTNVGFVSCASRNHEFMSLESSNDDNNLEVMGFAAFNASKSSHLRIQTKQWLKTPIGSWTLQVVSKGRWLIREWSSVGDTMLHKRTECARQQSKMVRRWMQEYDSGSEILWTTHSSTLELREMVHRCLNSWRHVDQQQGRCLDARCEALQLLQALEEIAKRCNSSNAASPTAKTYSMCLNILEQYPEVDDACRDIMIIFQHCQDKNLQFYHVCLGALAKCSAYHIDAPALAERVFADLISEQVSSRGLLPDTRIFVSLLHAWANGSELQSHAAERAEAILERMVQTQFHLVNTTCFNVVINAWARQGSFHRAEKVLWKMQSLSHEFHRDDLRTNTISFNSAIHALSTSKQDMDPVMAIEKAETLAGRMIGLGCNPTLETFTSIMQVVLRTENSGPKVQSILDVLEQHFADGQIAKAPDKNCYLIAVQAWGRTTCTSLQKDQEAESPQNAELLLRRMQEISASDGARSDLYPCVNLYAALINCWANSTNEHAPDHTLRLYREMLQMHGEDSVAHTDAAMDIVLGVFCKHDRNDEALALLKEYRLEAVGLHHYHTLLRAYINCQRLDVHKKIERIIYEMEEVLSLKPTAYTFSLVLTALGNSSNCGATSRAEETFWQMLDKTNDIEMPNVVHMNCVLRAWSKRNEAGAVDRAENFLRRVQHNTLCAHIEPDAISHLHLIHAWGRSGRRLAKDKAQSHLNNIVFLCNKDGKDLEILDKARAAFAKYNFINEVG